MWLPSLSAVLLGAFAWSANGLDSEDRGDNIKSISVWFLLNSGYKEQFKG